MKSGDLRKELEALQGQQQEVEAALVKARQIESAEAERLDTALAESVLSGKAVAKEVKDAVSGAQEQVKRLEAAQRHLERRIAEQQAALEKAERDEAMAFMADLDKEIVAAAKDLISALQGLTGKLDAWRGNDRLAQHDRFVAKYLQDDGVRLRHQATLRLLRRAESHLQGYVKEIQQTLEI